MKTTNKTTETIGIAIASAAITLVMLYIWVYSGTLLLSYWYNGYTSCIECVKTFSQHFFAWHNFASSLIFGLSSWGWIHGLVFLRREYLMHSASQKFDDTSTGPILVEHSRSTAWSSGIISPRIYANRTFWDKLTKKEQIALCAHEQSHVDNQETLQLFLLSWVEALIKFPLIHQLLQVIIHRKRLQGEVKADQNAIRSTSRLILASLLYKACDFESRPFSNSAPGVDSLLLQRVSFIVQKKPFKQSSYRYLLIFSVVCMCSIFVSLQVFISPISACS